MTRLAAWPVVNPEPFINSRTLSLASSVTQRLPEESKATAEGAHSVVGEGVEEDPLQFSESKSVCPRTTLAASPVVNGARYSRTLLLLESATHRLPWESIATAEGTFRVVEEGLTPFEVKVVCPRTTLAAWLVVRARAE